ncbi:MAG: polysaccharide biosynthesis protein [Ignavibacteriae bacterium]|nr:polysaccharide biosynthesis protein [Ignavibacteriota bacterium]
MKDFKKLFEGKKILVTGGTGSIGSEIVKQLLDFNPKQIRVFSRDEYKQFNLQNELESLKKFPLLTFLIGDVRDKERLIMAMEGIDICFHTAALKHVRYCEYNPFEAVKTNVFGTQNIVDTARMYNIEKLIGISTDKAASPVNTMGATKLLSEKLIISAEEYKGKRKTNFTSVRFGNVIGSRGSVIPLFINQIIKQKEITITDPEMTRFLMSIPQAANLVFKAAMYSNGGELFILKMPVVMVIDIAEVLIEIISEIKGFKKNEVKIKKIGSRRGEKTYELLLSEEESFDIYENEEMFCLKTLSYTDVPSGFKKVDIKSYKSSDFDIMDRKELKKELIKFVNQYIDI